MSIFTFRYFSDCEDGKMAHVETTGEHKIPINIFVDNASAFENLQERLCYIAVCGIGIDIEFFPSEEEYRASDKQMDIISLIPMGTFSSNPVQKYFEESPHIMFTGKVIDVDWRLIAERDEPNCVIKIETLEMFMDLFLRTDVPVRKGYIVHGIAWLFGDLAI